ncbi:G-box-binding factor 3-like isoform X2 [Papaver somniferum]|uniref:G-box-binding factor 3-like isoform X2 n=1 Tax=Papaver somniferum TaxID=3469 RepID=UPI000E7039FC|nr:G-box-binding factor 3-like isoform X2 [Papaver somniferum]
MGSSEAETTPSKSEKESSPTTQEQTSMPVYPNWAAMQAYYPPGMAMPPPPYYNPAVGSGHPPPPFMWGAPQGMMPPYGSPYGPIYAHGGVYAHPSVAPGAHSQGPAVTASPVGGEATVATPLSVTTPAKSSSNKEQGLMKKLKGFDGLVVTLGNGDANGGSGDMSHSGDYKTDGSSDGSDGNTARKQQPRRKRSCDDMTSTGAEVSKHEGVPSDLWVKSERELKRERRKQSNRESARRSRLRKQAETEELATKVEALNVENMSLKSEISRLAEKSEKLRLENAAIMEKLKNAQSSNMVIEEATQPISTENFLARVNNNSSQQESEVQENSNSGTKLHQLLESSPRTDAVAAG